MLDFNPSAFKRSKAVREIEAAIDQALVRKALGQSRRDYLGASGIGSPCERRTQYEYMKQPYDADYMPNARTQRIFARGHIAETLAIEWLREAGYRLKTENENGRQFRFQTANGKFAGHCDGIITHGPGLDTPCIWEHKAIGNKSFQTIASQGVIKSKPEYADQIAIYQAYFDLTSPAVFQATNMDTMELYFELVPFDKKRAQKASDRAVSIIQDAEAGALRPRVSDDPDYWLCQNKTGKCPFWRSCHAS